MTTTGYVCGFIGAGLTLASYAMKSMMPLRMVGDVQIDRLGRQGVAVIPLSSP